MSLPDQQVIDGIIEKLGELIEYVDLTLPHYASQTLFADRPLQSAQWRLIH